MYIKKIDIKNLIETKKIETKNLFINERNYRNLLIYFTGHVYCKSIKILSLY